MLALVQGLTEFLPISSSGHLVVMEELLQFGNDVPGQRLAMNIALHMGTLLAVAAFYFRHIARMIYRDHRVIGLVAVGTLPAVVVGVPLQQLGAPLESPLVSGLMLIVTGGVLLWAVRHPPGELDYGEITWRGALVIGIGQAAAILPGLSRSGTTIAVGMWLGMRPQSAATFSFLLAIPAILGAAVLQIAKSAIRDQTVSSALEMPQLIVGVFVSAAAGAFALWWLLHWLEGRRLRYFAYYCFLIGPAVLLWQAVSLRSGP